MPQVPVDNADMKCPRPIFFIDSKCLPVIGLDISLFQVNDRVSPLSSGAQSFFFLPPGIEVGAKDGQIS